MTTDKKWPEYGCHVELEAGEAPDQCVIDLGCPSDCNYGHTPSGRARKSPHTCKHWRKIKP